MRRRTFWLLATGAAIWLIPSRQRGARGQAPMRRAQGLERRPETLPQPAAAPESQPASRARGVVLTALKRAMAGNVTDVAGALAYYAFLAIPAALLVAVGVFGLVADEGAIQSVVDRLDGVVPAEALTLIDDTLTRVTGNSGGGLSLAIVGLLLALWTVSGAANALMRALNRIHGRTESRNFARQRLVALALVAWTLLGVVISFGLLVLGPPLSQAVGEAVGAESAARWIWWSAQWPILICALIWSLGAILRLGPDGDHSDRRALLAGAAVATLIWLVASGLFAVYVSQFGNYNAAWGSLSAVIVMLTWLWLTSLAILLGAQVAAEVERRRLAEPLAPAPA